MNNLAISSLESQAVALRWKGSLASSRAGRDRRKATTSSLQGQHQSGPVVGTHGAGPTGAADTEGHPHHVGAVISAGGHTAERGRIRRKYAVAVHGTQEWKRVFSSFRGAWTENVCGNDA